MTVAVSEDRKSGLTMTGVAAHITAAASGGPRYDPEMSSDERASERNGMWTCQIHGKLIDDNPSRCTVEELRRWKSQHESWVFGRVANGKDALIRGVHRVTMANVGPFKEECSLALGRNNILVGLNDTGKTSFCQILAAFSGGVHWHDFEKRFALRDKAAERAYIEVASQGAERATTTVRLSPQILASGKYGACKARPSIHVHVNGNPSPDWPRSAFRVMYFEDQLYGGHYKEPKDTFVKAMKYLARVLDTDEELIWDAMREELFTSSLFGYRMRRVGRRKAEILVPDGRNFFLPHAGLSFTEQQMAFLEMAIRLVSCTSANENWLYIFDSRFFSRLDVERKAELFRKLSVQKQQNVQTLFCLHSKEDAEILKNVRSEQWIGGEHIGGLTLHSFM